MFLEKAMNTYLFMIEIPRTVSLVETGVKLPHSDIMSGDR